ncbi:hypothetical protein MYX82_02585 [Acidobacteria bacterium AH-259-D05]|nr:hypothetical protein [Acidobacteria bacterium AH-259-D05]
MKVRWQRVLIYSLAGICCGLLLFTWNQRYIQGFHLDIMRNNLKHQARLMEPMFHLSTSTSDSEVDAIGEKVPYQITVIDGLGRVVADSLFSGKDLGHLENQLNQKEIVEAAQNRIGTDLRYYEATDGWFLYVAALFSTGEGFIRLSRPVSGPDPVADPL